MFIRRTQTRQGTTGESYYTYRLVETRRVGQQVRQVTLLNLGRAFSINTAHWPLLCARIEQLLSRQDRLIPLECPVFVEQMAQHCISQLIKQIELDKAVAETATDNTPVRDIQEVDVNTLQMTDPRSIGIEHAALYALGKLKFSEKLADLGINGRQMGAIIGNIVARMAAPASELSTWSWLQNVSALGELMDIDFASQSHMALYRGSDVLMKHRAYIEAHVFGTVQQLFSLEQTVTLFDLTNTYFEGEAAGNSKAQYGRSKEKRSDCPLVTLGLVLDRSGFIQRSQTFAGNVSEASTLSGMLTALNAPTGALVVMDAGIATKENIAWLMEHHYRYLVVQRSADRVFEHDSPVQIKTANNEIVRVYKALSEDGKEVILHCHSAGREAKERAMVQTAMDKFEKALKKLNEGLSKPRAEKRINKVNERIGRLKEKSNGTSQHYQITVTPDENNEKATQISWVKKIVPNTRASEPGVYCLRSNELSWSEKEMWETYIMLTDLESVFRSLKSELGLRPVFHSKENRVDGHLFITVLAYQCVQLIRRELGKAGIQGSWAQLRQVMSVQRRITVSMQRSDNTVLHIRKTTVPSAALREIYQALGINTQPGGVRKMLR